MRCYKRLSENIKRIILFGNKSNTVILVKYLFSNKIKINFYMLCTSMEDRIGIECYSRSIVTPQSRNVRKRKVKILK